MLVIAIEGITGAGKTTQARLLTAWLNGQNHQALCTKAPGGTLFGDKLHRITTATPPHSPMTGCLCRVADLAESAAHIIAPALKRSVIVVADGFADGIVAHYEHGHTLTPASVAQLCHIATDGLRPAQTILLDMPPTAALSRRQLRHALSMEAIEFQDRIRIAYLTMARRDPERFVVVNAQNPIQAVHRAIAEALRERLPLGQLNDERPFSHYASLAGGRQ